MSQTMLSSLSEHKSAEWRHSASEQNSKHYYTHTWTCNAIGGIGKCGRKKQT